MLLLIAGSIVCRANAQESGFGIRTNMNISNIKDKFVGKLDEGDKRSDWENDFKSRVGFNIGVIYDYGISEAFYVQPGLYFTTRGAKLKGKFGYEEKWQMSYLQIPILASYRITLSDNIKWHINAGPYIACGLGGKIKWKYADGKKGDYKIFGTTSNNNYDDDDDDDDYDYYSYDYDYDNDYNYDYASDQRGGIKRFDAGMSFGTGVSINKFYIGLNYDLGLINIADKKEYKENKMRNRNFSIGFGYNF